VIYANGAGNTPIWSTNTPVTVTPTPQPNVRVEAKPWGLVITLSHEAAKDLAAGGAPAAAVVAAASASTFVGPRA
jgi:hypothetical protein